MEIYWRHHVDEKKNIYNDEKYDQDNHIGNRDWHDQSIDRIEPPWSFVFPVRAKVKSCMSHDRFSYQIMDYLITRILCNISTWPAGVNTADVVER